MPQKSRKGTVSRKAKRRVRTVPNATEKSSWMRIERKPLEWKQGNI